MENNEPESIARMVIDACSDCDVCRFLMDTDCLMFPELYRLYDKERESGERITFTELRNLVDLCNFCALCPCPNIRGDIIKAKTQFIKRDGLKFGLRTLEDVERVARLCGVYPKMANTLFRNKSSSRFLKAAAGIHPARSIPAFPAENFPQWAKKHHLNALSKKQPHRKIAYFAGCTANYLFPDVAKAVVEVFQHQGFEVIFPEQKCCGMPSLLEGDQALTMKFVRFNLERLSEFVDNGYAIICSCPTCGFMLRNILRESAYYSRQYQESVGADEKYLKIPVSKTTDNPGGQKFELLKRNMYQGILKDDGYFSAIDPLKRIAVAENTFDVGQYLVDLHRSGDLKTNFNAVSGRMVYYPPCHLREQNVGRPYRDLLSLLPGIDLEPVDGRLYCCGMGGIMGFKKDFHDTSLRLGNRLMAKIKELQPEKLVTECLSCRLQFNQLLPYEVFHPIEILKEASKLGSLVK